jgi:hypothetical protein
MLEKLIVSGCSFTEGIPTEGRIAWPNYVAESLNLPLYNYAVNGAGNGYISRSVIHGVETALKSSNPQELLVGVMWSSIHRLENYHSDTDRFKSRFTFRFIDNDEGCWVSLRPWEEDNYTISYIKNYYDPVGSCIYALEHIVRTQWYLKSVNVKYFMSIFNEAGLPEESMMKHPNVKHLYDMIDWSNFLPVKTCWDWCLNSGFACLPEHLRNHSNLEVRYRATHPSREQFKGFAEQIVLPHINAKFNISV